jgi:integrase
VAHGPARRRRSRQDPEANRERRETRRLLKAARGDRLEALYVLATTIATTTGMRQGELLALKWEDVDLENATVSVRRTITKSGERLLLGEPKTKKSRRTIQLTGSAVRALREHLPRQMREIERLGDLYQDEGLVFTSEVGTLINPTCDGGPSPRLKHARLPQIRFHDLRHACATLLLSRNVHPKYVQELLGHSNIAIALDTYSHVIPGMVDRIARAMESRPRNGAAAVPMSNVRLREAPRTSAARNRRFAEGPFCGR